MTSIITPSSSSKRGIEILRADMVPAYCVSKGKAYASLVLLGSNRLVIQSSFGIWGGKIDTFGTTIRTFLKTTEFETLFSQLLIDRFSEFDGKASVETFLHAVEAEVDLESSDYDGLIERIKSMGCSSRAEFESKASSILHDEDRIGLSNGIVCYSVDHHVVHSHDPAAKAFWNTPWTHLVRLIAQAGI